MALRIRMQAGLLPCLPALPTSGWLLAAGRALFNAAQAPATWRSRVPSMVYGRDTSRDELVEAAVRKIFESPRPGPSGSCNSLADQADENSWPIQSGRNCSSSAHPVPLRPSEAADQFYRATTASTMPVAPLWRCQRQLA